MFFAPLRDQRRSPRQWIATPVHILMGKSRIEGTTLNLSEHGMYMFTASDIALGSEIEIVFRPPGEKETVQLSAVVRRKVVYLYGIEFLSNGSQPSEDRRFSDSSDEPALDSRDGKTAHP
jgi:PilZ domain-containing protein